MHKQKTNQGITLIALVITIIVLLILAGISISMAIGQNGIVTQAQNAVSSHDSATEAEQIKLATANAMIKALTGESSDKLATILGELDAEKIKDVKNSGNTARISYGDNEYIVDLANGNVAPVTEDKWDGTSMSEGLVGEGTDAKPYLIRSGADLKYLGEQMGKDQAIVGLNEDGTPNGCNAHSTFAIYKVTNDISLENHEFLPLGMRIENGSIVRRSFFGKFDGDNHKISNIKIDIDTIDVGFFTIAWKTTIKNLILDNVDIKGAGNVGGLVGHISSDETTTVIQNCHVSGKIASEKFLNTSINLYFMKSWQVGGLVGDLCTPTTIENCTTNVEIKGNAMVGGIVGQAENYRGNVPDEDKYGAQIINCVANGKIEADSDYGGLVGKAGGVCIKNSVSNMEIKSVAKPVPTDSRDGVKTMYVGGLVGYISTEFKMENSYSTGAIIMDRPVEYIGSIVGWMQTGKILNCHNTGAITCANTVDRLGGLVGSGLCSPTNCILTNVYNSGNVTVDTTKLGTKVGKICGKKDGSGEFTAQGCSNTGTFPVNQDYGN